MWKVDHSGVSSQEKLLLCCLWALSALSLPVHGVSSRLWEDGVIMRGAEQVTRLWGHSEGKLASSPWP